MQPVQRHSLTEPEYLALEEGSDLRHEYVAGEIYAMSGGSQRHNRIAGNMYVALRAGLSGRPCQVFMSDVKLHVASDSAYYYPDVMVTCGDNAVAANETAMVGDPVLVVEVLSPSTEAIDRREKLAAYRRLASVREYVLISQDRVMAEVYRRHGDAGWLYVACEAGDVLGLESLDLAMPVDALYAGTDIAPA